VFRTGNLGDTVVALPSLLALRRAFPRADVTVLCPDGGRGGHVVARSVLEGTSYVDGFMSYRLGPCGTARSVLSGLRAWWRIAGGGFDLCVNLAPSRRTMRQIRRDDAVFRSAGIRRVCSPAVLGQRWAGRWVHEADYLLAFLRACGIRTARPGAAEFDLQLRTDEARAADACLRAGGEQGSGPRVAFAPGSKMPAKVWPLDRFARLGASLIESHDIRPVVVGGAEDAALGKSVCAQWGRGVVAAGRLTVRQTAALMRACRCYIGNDTGGMHLAAAVGLPCVAVFSCRDAPGRWHPYGRGHRVLRSARDCAGCMLTRCRYPANPCVCDITVEAALAAAEDVLAEMQTGSRRKERPAACGQVAQRAADS
jgi:ADP-heptose:LPS heptosyltransferase